MVESNNNNNIQNTVDQNYSIPLPPHYFQYKGNFRRCAAIQVIFEYFNIVELIKVQQLSKRFYGYITPGICPKVPIRRNTDYTELMKKQLSRVMIFSKQSNFYTLSNTTNYKWVSQPFVIQNQETDLNICPTEWPKNVQISQHEWLFFGGGDQAASMT